MKSQFEVIPKRPFKQVYGLPKSLLQASPENQLQAIPEQRFEAIPKQTICCPKSGSENQFQVIPKRPLMSERPPSPDPRILCRS